MTLPPGGGRKQQVNAGFMITGRKQTSPCTVTPAGHARRTRETGNSRR